MKTNPRILIVDDDQNSARLIETAVSGLNFESRRASNGREALDLMEQEDVLFEAIILDWMMPVMTGIEFLREIKGDARYKRIPVIMQTANDDQDCVQEGINAGAYYFLTKPFDHQLLSSITRAAVFDYQHYMALERRANKEFKIMGMMSSGELSFSTPREAEDISEWLASVCEDRGNAMAGISELASNAVEHGNLGITYDEKSELMLNHEFHAEVQRRLRLPENMGKRVRVNFTVGPEKLRIHMKDEGPGFDFAPFLVFNPERVFDAHGRGIALARNTYLDHMEYIGDGNEVLIEMQLSEQAREIYVEHHRIAGPVSNSPA